MSNLAQYTHGLDTLSIVQAHDLIISATVKANELDKAYLLFILLDLYSLLQTEFKPLTAPFNLASKLYSIFRQALITRDHGLSSSYSTAQIHAALPRVAIHTGPTSGPLSKDEIRAIKKEEADRAAAVAMIRASEIDREIPERLNIKKTSRRAR